MVIFVMRIFSYAIVTDYEKNDPVNFYHDNTVIKSLGHPLGRRKTDLVNIFNENT